MAHVEKGWYTLPIPAGATIVQKKGERFARFKRKGRTVDAKLTKDGTRCRIETEVYYVRYKSPDGRWKRRKGYTDRQATEALGVRLERGVARKVEGITDPHEQHLKRPILEHVDDFQAHLEARRVSPGEVQGIANRLKKIVNQCGFQRIGELSPSKVELWLAELRGQGRSAQTCNHYLQSIKQFSRWLVRDGRMAANPLGHLEPFNVQVDRRHDRRALTGDELAHLVAAAQAGGPVEGLAGPDRAMLYVLSAWTGYRRKELDSLTRRSFRLSESTPTVRVRAAYTKNQRDDETPLHPAVVAMLETWLKTKADLGSDEKLFPLQTARGWWRKTSKMMREDLKRAREAWIKNAKKDPEESKRRKESAFLRYQDDEKLFADFHAHRHTFITNLGRARVPLAMAQDLARHSTADLTSNVYTHLELADRVAAIESLPAPKTLSAPPAESPPAEAEKAAEIASKSNHPNRRLTCA